MNSVINTLLSEQLLPFWVLLLIVFIERYLPWPDKYHPISFIKVLAMGMQTKVLSPGASSIRQQKLSGSLACIVLLLPFCAILVVFKYLSEYPVFFEALMLLVALRFQDIPKQTNRVTAALAKQKKMLARHALSLPDAARTPFVENAQRDHDTAHFRIQFKSEFSKAFVGYLHRECRTVCRR